MLGAEDITVNKNKLNFCLLEGKNFNKEISKYIVLYADKFCEK